MTMRVVRLAKNTKLVSVESKSAEIKRNADTDAAKMRAEEMQRSVQLPESESTADTRRM